MRFAPHLVASVALALVARAAAAEPAPTDELAAYAAMGSAVSEQMRLRELGWTDAQFAAFVRGFRAAYEGRSYPVTEATQRLFADTQRRLAAASSGAATTSASPSSSDAESLEPYFARVREDFLLQRSFSGLLYRVIKGSGPRPRLQDTVVLSIAARGADATTAIPQLSGRSVRTKVADLLPGLAEGVQMMALGGEGFFVLAPDLSFGSGAWPDGVERGAPILFQVQLASIQPDADSLSGRSLNSANIPSSAPK